MIRRIQAVNIPTDILRTVASIVDTGSYNKAGARLNLSQPAISAQMKRLQVLVGGAVFERVAGGVRLTEMGKLLLPHVRRLLEANDQILSIGGCTRDARPVRLGLSDPFVGRFIEAYDRDRHGDVTIASDSSSELGKGLMDGYVDVACLLRAPPEIGLTVARWQETFVWVRSRDFVVSPGAPIPLVGWPGLLGDQIAVTALEEKGLAYRFALTSGDHQSRLAAVAAGLGILVLPSWRVAPPLIAAREYYLPKLPPVEGGVLVRRDFDQAGIKPLLGLLASLAPQPGQPCSAQGPSGASRDRLRETTVHPDTSINPTYPIRDYRNLDATE